MNKTKELLLEITFDLLYKKGFCATAIMDVLKLAKVTKGAMYYHFESKDALVLETMKYYLEQILESHWIEPFSNSDKPIEILTQQIESYLFKYEDENNFMKIQHGCPISNFILDMSDKDDIFFAYLQNVYLRWHKSVEKALTKAQILKQTKTDFNAEHQALFIISSLEGSIGSAKAYNDINTLKTSVKILSNYIKNL